jgi:phosphatidylserine decarboxylase
MPKDHRVHQEWLSGVINHVQSNPTDLHPVLKEFKDLIEKNTRVYLLVQSMFQQVPNKHPYNKDPTGNVNRIKDYEVGISNAQFLLCTSERSELQGG